MCGCWTAAEPAPIGACTRVNNRKLMPECVQEDVTAVLTASATDVLSHIAIRARSQQARPHPRPSCILCASNLTCMRSVGTYATIGRCPAVGAPPNDIGTERRPDKIM